MCAPNNKTTLAVVFLFGAYADLNLLRPKRLERFGAALPAGRGTGCTELILMCAPDLNLLRPKRLERFGTARSAARRARYRMYRVNPDVCAINVKTTLAVVFLFGAYADLNLLRPKRLERFGTARSNSRRARCRMYRVNPDAFTLQIKNLY
jgi:hypothetical protein